MSKFCAMIVASEPGLYRACVFGERGSLFSQLSE